MAYIILPVSANANNGSQYGAGTPVSWPTSVSTLLLSIWTFTANDGSTSLTTQGACTLGIGSTGHPGILNFGLNIGFPVGGGFASPNEAQLIWFCQDGLYASGGGATNCANRVQMIFPALTAGQWHQTLISADFVNKLFQCYVDGVPQSSFIYQSDYTPYYGNPSISLGDLPAFPAYFYFDSANPADARLQISATRFDATTWSGCSADYWLMLNQSFVDLSNPTNLAKFITVGGDPVDYGADGKGPLGVAPFVWLTRRTGDSVSAFYTNRGNGSGTFVANDYAYGGCTSFPSITSPAHSCVMC